MTGGPGASPPTGGSASLARGLCLGLGTLLLLGTLRAALGRPMADPALPAALHPGLHALGGALLLTAALGRARGPRRLAGLLLLAAAALHLWGPGGPLAWRAGASLLAGLLLLLAPGAGSPRALLLLACAGAAALAWPLVLTLEAGRQGPRSGQPAPEMVVVLGARTYADGRPSLALTDRVRTGAQLVLAGGATPRLVLSGGPGDGPVHEAQAMARLAQEFGVAQGQLQLDPLGHDTRATAEGAAGYAAAAGLTRAVAVSHAYHLPRVRQAFLDAGLPVRTVAAVESRRLARRAWFVLREQAAWWVYWLRGFRLP